MFRKGKYTVTKGQVFTLSTEHIISTSPSTENFKENDDANCCRVNYRRFISFFFILISSICVLQSLVIVKKISYISPGQLSLVRNFGVLVCSLPIGIYCNKNILGPKMLRFILILQSFSGATAVYLNLIAFRNLPLAEATIIMSTMPAVVGITSRIYLKEPCGVVQTCATVLTICGVLLSIQLPELIRKREDTEFNTNYIIGLVCAVSCVIFVSATVVLTRKLKDVHFSITLIYSGFMGILESAAIVGATSFYSWPRCGYDPVLIMLIGIFGFIGHFALIVAIQTENVGILTVLKTAVDIIIAMIFQVIYFDFDPNVYNVGGALLVIVCIGIIGIRKWLQDIPEDATVRKRLKYLLF